ncbi:MAG TPA: J domain-containing protein, partial [Polyangiaceae bacterium]|nr:J domain-containing protein [Polyangiaceae bacterium]
MSHVDGVTSSAEIAEQTGKLLAEVSSLLERLLALGAIAFDERRAEPLRAAPAPAPRTSGALRMGPIVETSAAAVDVKHPAASLYDPAELDEAVDIELPRRRQILDLFYRLDQVTHYQLFGIAPDADKKAIKEAYFEIVNVFHPDRYFGKNVGSFRPKLERVFSRLTESYDVLSRKASRAEYDAYLAAQSKTRAFDAGQVDNAAHQAALRDVMQRIQAEASVQNRAQTFVAPPVDTEPASARPHQSVSPIPGSVTPSPSSLRPSSSLKPNDPEARRRALARKLGRSLQPGPPEQDSARATAPQADGAQRHEWAAEELKRRYHDAVQAARDRQVDVYLRAAKVALEKNDNVGASNALRIAVSLA